MLLAATHFNENRAIQDVMFDEIKYDNLTHADNEENTFEQGIFYLHEGNWVQARHYFSKLAHSGDHFHSHYTMNLSLLGVTEVLLLKSNGGLYRCYDALKEAPDNKDLYFHIAYAEYLLGHRRRCLRALKNCQDHVFAKQLISCIGVRSKKRKTKISVLQQSLLKLFRKTNDVKIKTDAMTIFTEYLASKQDNKVCS